MTWNFILRRQFERDDVIHEINGVTARCLRVAIVFGSLVLKANEPI